MKGYQNHDKRIRTLSYRKRRSAASVTDMSKALDIEVSFDSCPIFFNKEQKFFIREIGHKTFVEEHGACRDIVK